MEFASQFKRFLIQFEHLKVILLMFYESSSFLYEARKIHVEKVIGGMSEPWNDCLGRVLGKESCRSPSPITTESRNGTFDTRRIS